MENNNCPGNVNSRKRSWSGQQLNVGQQSGVLAKVPISLFNKDVDRLEKAQGRV